MITKENKKATYTDEEVSIALLTIGFKPSNSGYHYAREIMRLLREDYDYYMSGVTKILYPEVAKSFDTTASRVERGIRHAVECIFAEGNYEEINKVFRYYNPSKGKLSNTEFFAGLYEYFRLNKFKLSV